MTFCALLAAVLPTLVFGGCADETAAPNGPDADSGGRRIVSLSPAISRTLRDFGLEDAIVGRTPWCESIDQAIPVVGDLYNLDYEAVVRLAPTHVLVQPPAMGVDATLVELADERGWVIGQWTLDTVEDIESMVMRLPSVLARDDEDSLRALSSRAAELLNAIAQAVSPQGADVFAGRTLVVIGYEPLMAFGPGTYLHDLLLSLGGTNAMDRASYVSLTFEDIVRLNPEAIIYVKPHAAPDTDPLGLLGPLAESPLASIQSGRVALLSHPEAIAPSTGLIEVADEMRAILVSFAAGGS